MLEPTRVLTLTRWLAEQGLAGPPDGDLLAAFCDELRHAGVPLHRGVAAFEILDPLTLGRLLRWSDGGTITEEEMPRLARDEDEEWLRSPFHLASISDPPRRRWRLDGDEPPPDDLDVLAGLRAEGFTDYLAIYTPFGPQAIFGGVDGVYSSWATMRSGGFDDTAIVAFEHLVPTFALALKASVTRAAAITLMATYLGRDAGARVLRGAIDRGAGDAIPAIIWYSDLQGFTRIADTLPREQLMPLLNDYADGVVQAVHDHGGDVLKFMGDGLLAIFELADGSACNRALDAAEAALAAIAGLNERRRAAGLMTTEMYLGLHVGEVLYGNVGSRNRLDFTVIGPAVNEASRIERMCRSLEQPVIVSSAFAQEAPECAERLVSLGRYALRGVRRPQELFTLNPSND